MFWRVASGSVTSSVEAILSNDSFTLGQLLAETDLVQEIKQPNKQLVEYLLQEDTLVELMHYLVDPPSEDVDEDDKFSLPYAACEVICCEVEEISDAIASSPKIFDVLFAAPAEKLATDGAMSGFFARAVAFLMTQKGPELFSWLESHRDVLTELTERLETTGAAETLVRLVGADDQTTSSLTPEQMAWLTETDVLEILLLKMEGGDGPIVAENSVEVLAAIARARTSPLTHDLGRAANIQRLVDYTASPAVPTHSLVQTLTICIALVERRNIWQTAHDNELAKSPPREADAGLEQRAVKMLAPHAAHLLKRLSEDHDQPTMETPYGLQKPLGSTRLTVLALVAVMLRTGMPEAEEAVEDSGLLSLCLMLFTQYPFNSILHHQVATILGSIMDRGSDHIIEHLLEACGFVDWLIGAPSTVAATPAKGDSKVRQPLQAGYTGHITQIGTKLTETAEGRSLVAEHLRQHAAWQEFAAGRLAKAKQMEDLSAWECGRPDLNSKNTGNSDEAYFMEGDLAVTASFSSFEANTFGIQSAFNIDSGSDEDSPTRADTLFADADDYDASSPALAEALHDLHRGDWGEPADEDPIPKSFNQRTRNFGESAGSAASAGDAPTVSQEEDEMETVDLGPSRKPVMGNGLASRDVHSFHPATEDGNVPESWETIADGGVTAGRQKASGSEGPAAASPKRILGTPTPISCFQEARDIQPEFVRTEGEPIAEAESDGPVKQCESPPANASPSFPKGSREWDENDPTPTLETSLAGSLEKSPLKHALVAGGMACETPGPPQPPESPPVDHAELRQPGQLFPVPEGGKVDSEASNEESGSGAPPLTTSQEVRHSTRKRLGRARKSRDTDAHPLSLRSKSSMESDDIAGEISAALAMELKEDEATSSSQAREGGSAGGEEHTLVGSFTKLELGGAQDGTSQRWDAGGIKGTQGKAGEDAKNSKGKAPELQQGWDKPETYLQMLDHSPRKTPPL